MLLSIYETQQKILKGEMLLISGDELALKQLPKGKWIGGTIPYFMDINGGICSKDKVFVNKLDNIISYKINSYTESDIKNITSDSFENGYSILIIPATSRVHIEYAEKAPNYKNIFLYPIIGWISGVHLNDLGKISPKVINGETLELMDQKAISMHLELPQNKVASIGIINLFEQSNNDIISFNTDGFEVIDCLINGKIKNFYDYIVKNNIDIKLPLVSDYNGINVNVSIQSLNEQKKSVSLYAPVFKKMEYRTARNNINNYVEKFMNQLKSTNIKPIFSFNCILNYLYSELEGKKTGNITGTITFGEIAYQLLNQTLVYLEIQTVS